MKLNLNPKEFLAVYNLLHQVTTDQGKVASSEASLVQVCNRMKACILGALTRGIDPVDAWFKREQDKIDNLRHDNESLKEVATKIMNEHSEKHCDLEEVDVGPAYPRSPRMPRPAKRR